MNILNPIRRSMKRKLAFAMIAVNLLIVGAMGLFSYWETAKTVRHEIDGLATQIIKQTNLNLSRYISEYEYNFLMFAESSEVKDWLTLKPDDKLGSFSVLNKVTMKYLQPFFAQHPEILSITLYNKNGNEINVTTRYGFNYLYSFSKDSVLQQLAQSDRMTYIVRINPDFVDSGNSPLEIPVVSMIKKISYGKESGFLKWDIDLNPIYTILQEIKLGQKGVAVIVDREGRIVAHPDRSLIAAKSEIDYLEPIGDNTSGSYFRKDTNEMVMYTSVPYTGWYILAVVPFGEVAKSVGKIKQITWITALAGLVFSVVLAIGISSTFTKRLARLRQMIKRTELGSFDRRLDIEGVDEIADLSRAYNRMLENLESSVVQLAESKTLQQQAVLSALQSQINSHFLYNTLETINSLANLAGHREIETTTIALSKMLRYTADYKTAVVTVQDELEHLHHYLQIIGVRFGADLMYDVQVAEDVRQAPCLKAILQPIAENSVKHGLEATGEPIRFTVAAGREGHLVVIRIADDGLGFEPDKLSRIQRRIESLNESEGLMPDERIGVLNVHSRLRMFYRHVPEAGLRLYNDPDGGAVVEIRFPAAV
jgi:two-component system sensor histidine kinase YesM